MVLDEVNHGHQHDKIGRLQSKECASWFAVAPILLCHKKVKWAFMGSSPGLLWLYRSYPLDVGPVFGLARHATM